MDLSKLTPQQQAAIFSVLKNAGQQPTSGGAAPDTEDPQAQQGTGSVDASQAAQLFGAPSIQKQDGDQMHPLDAISQIGNQMFGPPAPAGASLATGPQLTQGANGKLVARLPADHPLLRAFGVKQSVPVNNPNYFQAAKDAGLTSYLPSGLAQMPDGTPFVGPETYQRALASQKTLVGQGNQVYTSIDQLTSQGVPEDVARNLMAANPKGVTNKEVSNQMGQERLKSTNTIAAARATMAGVAKLGQALKVGGFDAAQPMAETANKNLGAVQRVQAAIDQVTANGGQANEIQRAEIAAGLAALAGNSQGVITDERMNRFLPDTLKNKYGNFMEMLKNERNPVDFTGFLPQFQDLLTREKQANQGISDAASQLGINIMGLSQPQAATGISQARNASPILGQAPAPTSVTPPTRTAPKPVKIKTASDYLSKFGGH